MKIVEIFQSIDGEAVRAGGLANFIRMAGCNLRCSYCDTDYALEKSNGEEMSVEEILSKLDKKIKNITLTGGEPLWDRENAFILLKALVNSGYDVSVETNGSIELEKFIKNFPTVCFIVDYKSPSSGMERNMYINNFKILRKHDCVKFVVQDKKDLEIMEKVCIDTGLNDGHIPIFLSAVFNKIELSTLVEFIMERKLTYIRLQIQMHKIIWNPMLRGV